MALLSMCKDQNLEIEVAHVNYHKRDSANRDENIVFKFCKKNKIKFHCYDFDPESVKGNFQAQARIARYQFFKEVCEKRKLDAVLVAHHMDDLIETYFMQKEKQLGVDTYGLKRVNNLYGVIVIRPLLKYTKKQLEDYCVKNDIEYGIDESNLENHYKRNIVRHSKIEYLTLKQKKEIVKTINELNKEKDRKIKNAKKALKKEKFSVDEFCSIEGIDLYLKTIFSNKSKSNIDEMLRQIKTSKNCLFDENGYVIVKEYDYVMFFQKPFEYSYTFETLDDLKGFQCEDFKILKKSKGVNGVCLKEEDFPITIRNYKQNDQIQMKFGTKKINRFFIDKKMSLKDRLSWPIMFDKKGIAILVPSLGCDVLHYSSYNIFMVK